MDKHKHKWDENLECACGAKFGPPIKRNPISTNKPAIQTIVELRNKINKSLDEAMEEILELEKKNKSYTWNSKPDTKNNP